MAAGVKAEAGYNDAISRRFRKHCSSCAFSLSRFCLRSVLPILAAPAPPALGAGGTAAFGVAAHSDVNIEWWYVNAHVTTDKGRHLALIGSFFRFGTGVSPFDGISPVPRAHYLIYAVTDLDKKTQRPYSLADVNMIALLKQFGPLLAAQNPKDKGAQAFLLALSQGKLPPPHQKIAGQASIVNAPFNIAYGLEQYADGDECDQQYVLLA